MSNIEWTDATWNPVIGCSSVSEGCRNCYAETMASRLSAMGQEPYQGLTAGTGRKAKWTGVARFLPDRLALPLRWRKPRRIFVNSMSDLFHEGVTFEQIAAVFGVMAGCPQHTFQVLTKRPERATEFYAWAAANRYRLATCMPSMENGDMVSDGLQFGPWPPPNVWLGVSVEDQKTADKRIPLLLRCPAAVRWVSAEPLLGAVNLRPWLQSRWAGGCKGGCLERDLTLRSDSAEACSKCGWPLGGNPEPPLHWVVCGGESGRGARPMHSDWARSLRDQCRAAGVPFLFKQWGAWADWTGRDLHGIGDAFLQVLLPSGEPVGGGAGRHGMLSDACERPDAAWMVRVGKSAAGRLLDGRLWDEYPEQG